jgi:acetyl/propionyl-CoA carboxylase alpha subunit
MPVRRLLVANRGEIAIRILRACHDLGIDGVAVYSDADVAAPHVRHADRAERIGPAAAASSYLDPEAIIAAAQRSGADAVHPGYGFLSENAAFARAVEAAGLTFVGPPPEALARLGDKVEARALAAAAGVPVVPGRLLEPGDDLGVAAAELGFPLLVKAAAGGGGRGMRRIESGDGVAGGVELATAEAQAAFGRGTVYLERVIEPARHVEVQLLGDRHGAIASLGERDCSVQRRHQKLVEESPAPGLDEDLRRRMAADARAVAATVPFSNAATVEFLVDADGHHYFLEVNTRLQVEHGVTELVAGLDLVAWQLRIAGGDALPAELTDIRPRGHAIEIRIYAEDPWREFEAEGGTIGAWQMPSGPGVRVEAGAEAGYALPTEYDPLLAKILVHGADRAEALARLRRAIAETTIGGVATDLGFHAWLADQPDFASGGVDTGFVERAWRHGPDLSTNDREIAALAALAAAARGGSPPGPLTDVPDLSGWGALARHDAVDR